MTTVEILRAARALIEDPLRWTQGVSARDRAGRLCDPRDDDAVCWCMGGALHRVLGETVDCRTDMRFVSLWEQVNRSVGPWQDRREHEDVMHAFDRAIEAEEAKARA